MNRTVKDLPVVGHLQNSAVAIPPETVAIAEGSPVIGYSAESASMITQDSQDSQVISVEDFQEETLVTQDSPLTITSERGLQHTANGNLHVTTSVIDHQEEVLFCA